MKEYNFFYLPVARAVSQVRILRECLLPRPGEVTTIRDSRVEPVDVVARATLPDTPVVWNIAKLFKISPSQVAQTLQKKTGDSFTKGDVLARYKPLMKTPQTLRAPTSGTVIAVHRGEMLVQATPLPLEVKANIVGTVINVMPRFGVVIQTPGALVQGVWGNGREHYGVLKLVSEVRTETLTAELVDVSCLGMLVAIGGSLTAEALKQGEAQKVGGMIAGSMPASLREQAMQMPFPVMITEGFGKLPMTEPAFGLLTSYKNREASLRAVSQTRWGAQRPELVVPLPARDSTGETLAPVVSLQAGVTARVCAGEHQGQVGKVVSAKPQSRTLAGGVRARAVEIELSNEERFWVPINNLEAIA